MTKRGGAEQGGRNRVLARYLIPAFGSPTKLADWLNRTAGTNKGTRVARIIQLLQIERALQALPGSRSEADRRRLVEIINATNEDYSTDELGDLCGRYWVSPRLRFTSEGPRLFYVSTDAKLKTRNNVDPDELAAAVYVIQLGTMGDELDRIRKCFCGKFYQANRIDRHYCSTACRVRHHQSSPEFKGERRRKMREYYELKKSGKVSAKESAHGTRKAR
jgi:hypothetical protein